MLLLNRGFPEKQFGITLRKFAVDASTGTVCLGEPSLAHRPADNSRAGRVCLLVGRDPPVSRWYPYLYVALSSIPNLVDCCDSQNLMDKLFGLYGMLFVHALRLFFALPQKISAVDKLYPFTSL